MTTHIATILIMAFVPLGVYAAMQDGMILHWLGKALDRLPSWIHKPTHTCPVCMVSVWGIPTVYYVAALAGIAIDPFMLPVYLLAAAGINWAIA